MNKLFLLLSLVFFTSQVTFAQTTDPAPYCDASFDDMQGYAVDDHINSVSFGTLNNVTNSQYAAPHYVFYNNLSVADFVPGNDYTLIVNFLTAGGCGYGVWIDYNQNNIFEPSEKIAGTTGYDMLPVGEASSITQSVTIPTTAMTGNTRMRVRIVEDDNHHATSTDELPCNESSSATDVMDWGETEDYTINIVGTTGISEGGNKANLDIFPNPSTGIFTIQTNNMDIETIEIYSLQGNLIYKQAINNSESIIDLSNLSKGSYFLKAINTTQTETTKIISIQ